MGRLLAGNLEKLSYLLQLQKLLRLSAPLSLYIPCVLNTKDACVREYRSIWRVCFLGQLFAVMLVYYYVLTDIEHLYVLFYGSSNLGSVPIK